MGNYSVRLQRTASATLSVGVIQATATTPRRLKVYDAIFGCEATPADNPFRWTINRITAAGTPAGGSAVTPQKLDDADVASLFDANQGHTTDPTISATPLIDIALNQRATFRWVAAPGSELVSPATDNLGFGVMTPTSSALVVTANLLVQEQ